MCDKIEASGNTAVANKDLVNNSKTMWYLSIQPLPDIIKNNPRVQRDVATCSAITALMTRPMYSLLPPPIENDYKYRETTYSGFDNSAIFCTAPVEYQIFIHKSLNNAEWFGEYSCPASNLPFDEFPGWDDPYVYSPLCRGWYKACKEKPK